MNTSCRQCGKQLKLSEKLQNSIMGLEAGRSIRIKCPSCSGAIVLDKSLFAEKAPQKPKPEKVVSRQRTVKPPDPPDIEWLKEGVYDEERVIEDVPLALILMQDSEARDTIIESIEGIGYKTEIVKTPEEAMEKMEFVEYSAVVLHTRFEGMGLASSSFHKFMCNMHMSRRRFVYYILVGQEFKTLYNLQALSYSANLVVSENEIPYFNVIIRKSIPEYEELFGPIMEELRLQGR